MDITKATTRQERAECFHAQMHRVAAALVGFAYRPKKDENNEDWLGSGELTSGQERATLYVSFRLDEDLKYNKTPYRADCCGVYPRTAKGENYPSYGDTRPSIGFQLTRTPAQVAGDITRRLLPEYRTFYEKVARWVQTSDAAAATLDATRRAMQEIGFSFTKESNEGQMLFARGEKLDYSRPGVYVYGGHVDLKLKNLKPEQVLPLLELLNLAPVPAYV